MTRKSSIFFNPSGFIEQHYHDGQTPETSLEAIKQLKSHMKKIRAQSKPVLIYIDITKLKKIDLSSKMLHVRAAAVKAMKDCDFDKAAICGPLPVQVLVTTLALVAGKSKKIKVFDNRIQGVEWLLND
jgi:fatty acid-binding protein DegV